MFNMVTGINEFKTLTKHISCECKCKFDERKFDIINMKNVDPNNIKIDENSYKNILIYDIGYVMIKDSKYVKIDSVNPLYLIFGKVNWYSEEINGNKY